MKFVKTEALKVGMRLARPIYNRDGVLLYERNSKLTSQGIQSIRNFALIGIFVLEPAEPVPPMTEEDIAFERYQTMAVFALKEELAMILQTKKAPKIQVIASNVIKNYGRLDHKINFIQNLRSREDFIYKHSVNVAMLCAMIARNMNAKPEEQLETVLAALVHDIGRLTISDGLGEKEKLTEQEKVILQGAEAKGHEVIDLVFSSNPNIKRICAQSQKALSDFYSGTYNGTKLVKGAKILMVAELFDSMTAMSINGTPESEVAAIRLLLERKDAFDEKAVGALIKSINLLRPGLAVELNTGEKGIVITANDEDILYPVVLSFQDNQVLDLSDRNTYGDLEIKDIMKTLDNRHVMDIEFLRENGYMVQEPEYAKVPDEEPEEAYVPGRDF
ncbi:MAG: HD domain-containing protein [Roseburia sp.]|nr:HD domain-containing protein [Roseburia sp.]MCM1278071.1 HD domain-containing protein [Robinsoniella sp.]